MENKNNVTANELLLKVKETEGLSEVMMGCLRILDNLSRTPDQQEKFLQGTKNHRFHLAYKLLFYTGCRRSEILGLSWESINFEQSQINIKQVLVSINGAPILKNYPKTKSSLHP
mgnify:CR=1 FL=1